MPSLKYPEGTVSMCRPHCRHLLHPAPHLFLVVDWQRGKDLPYLKARLQDLNFKDFVERPFDLPMASLKYYLGNYLVSQRETLFLPLFSM